MPSSSQPPAARSDVNIPATSSTPSPCPRRSAFERLGLGRVSCSDDIRAFSAGLCRDVDRFVRTHIGQPLRAADLATYVGLSKSHFSRTFHAAVGVTPSDFIAMARLEAAAGMLLDSRLPALDIAMRCGFSDSSHMCKSFKRHLGKTPTECRNLLLEA